MHPRQLSTQTKRRAELALGIPCLGIALLGLILMLFINPVKEAATAFYIGCGIMIIGFGSYAIALLRNKTK